MNAESNSITIAQPGGDPVTVTIAHLLNLHDAGQLPEDTLYARGGKWHPIAQVIKARAAQRAASEPAIADAQAMKPPPEIGFEEPGIVTLWQIIGMLNGVAGVIVGIVMLCGAGEAWKGWAVILGTLFFTLLCATGARIISYLAEIAHHAGPRE